MIKKAYLEVPQRKQAPKENTSDAPPDDSTGDMIQSKTNFNSLYSTVVWFLEHDSFTNVAMNLNANCCKVVQENFKAKKKMDINFQEAIQEKNGDTLQNSPIHLLFYEKISKSVLSSNAVTNPPELSSLSWVKLNQITQAHLDDLAYTMELQRILSDVSAQFVSPLQYEVLLYVLGQKQPIFAGQSCKDVLMLFDDFPTHTTKNFKSMLHWLQLPFVYNDNKSIFDNR